MSKYATAPPDNWRPGAVGRSEFAGFGGVPGMMAKPTWDDGVKNPTWV